MESLKRKRDKIACPYCHRIHERTYVCDSRTKAKTKDRHNHSKIATQVHNSTEWRHKREDILERDHYLCQSCIKGLIDGKPKINAKQLEVHHITKIELDSSKAYEDTNLITLCNECHRLAETGQISAETLRDIATNNFNK